MAAKRRLYGNNAESILDALLLIGGTSISLPVGDGGKFPAIGTVGLDEYQVTLTDGPNETIWEIVTVTDRVGDVLTVVRGREGTTPVEWPATFTTVNLRNTKETMDAFFSKDEANTEHVEVVSSVATVLTLDLAESNNFATTLTENTTVAFTNVPASPELAPITLEVLQDGAGGWTLAWPAATKWPGGVIPVVSPGIAALDAFGGYTRDGGVTIPLARTLEDLQ